MAFRWTTELQDGQTKSRIGLCNVVFGWKL